MPTLKAFSNARVLVYFDDHPPPHVHIKMRDQRDSSVDLATLEVKGTVPEREIREALSWIEANLGLLRDEWKRCNP
ncbi:MAG: DUF4160 domain-containing protein [Thauera sp.]|jgi:hypothetical protein|nr:DUF4160 domain-containing protein [Thauera sp.]